MQQTCHECGFTTKSPNGFGYHLRMTHQLSGEEYYKKYFLKSNERTTCVICGKPALFHNYDIGYGLFCSKKCSKTGKYNPAYGTRRTYPERRGVPSWNKGISPSEYSKQKRIDTMKKNGTYGKSWNTGLKMPYKPKSDEWKRKHRVLFLDRLEKCVANGGQLQPWYNPKGCEYFNQLMKENNCYIQHAENGGEFHIKELGYWVDGYDVVNNTVYEYDERAHFNPDGSLCDGDVKRQKEITELLKCKFVRIKA